MQDLILSKRLESMVFNPELMGSSEWAYLISMENVKNISEDINLFGPTSSGGSSGLFGSFERSNTQHCRGQPGGASRVPAQTDKGGNKDTENNKDLVDRLQGIIDAEDPRFDKMKSESIGMWENRVNELCDSMNMGIDRFYARKSNTYNTICNTTYFCREEFCPSVNTKFVTEANVTDAQKNWQFNSLPGVNLKFASLAEDPQHLARLSHKLQEFEPLGLWHEPIDLDENCSAFFVNVRRLMLEKAQKLADTPVQASEVEGATREIGDAISCLLGLGVLSGNFTLIVKALDAIHAFQKALKAEQSDQVFAHVGPQIKHYLKQIEGVANKGENFHAMLGQNMSGIYGISKHFHNQNARLTNKNVSMTTDGKYLYLYICQSPNNKMLKIGTGEEGTVAGKIALDVSVEKEGDLTWVYCQGRLYARRHNAEFGNLVLFDPKNLKKLGEARLVCEDLFKGNKALKMQNQHYPLLTDGKDLYALIFTVEKRERAVIQEKKEMKEALAEAKKKKSSEQAESTDKSSTDAEKQKKETDQLAAQLKDQAMKKMRPKGKKSTREQKEEEKKGQETYTAQRDMHNYYVAVFSLHRFDVSGGQKALEAQELAQMTDQQLYEIPIVKEMKGAFADFFSIKDCAKALKMHEDDIEEAAAWLCEQGENPSVKWQIPRTKVIPICESIVTSKWIDLTGPSSGPSSGQAGKIGIGQPPSGGKLSKVFENSQSWIPNQGFGAAKGSDCEVQVTKEAILTPNCIEPGRWTMSESGQLTFCTVDKNGESGVNYVFSTKENDYMPLKGNLKKLKESHHQAYLQLFADNMPYNWFWDGTKWVCYTPQNIIEGVQRVAEESIREQLKKEDEEKAKDFHFISEWELFEDVQTRSSLVAVVEDKQSIILQLPSNYTTYDFKNNKFLNITLDQSVRNIIVVDDLSKVMPLERAEPPKIDDLNSLAKTPEMAYELLLWANQKRFSMPQRWSTWSNLYKQVIEFLEHGRKFADNPLREEDQNEEGETLKHGQLIKKLNKRLLKVREREAAQELARLGLEVLPEDEATLYRNKVKKQLQAEQKAEEKRKANAEKDKTRASSSNLESKTTTYSKVPRELMKAMISEDRGDSMNSEEEWALQHEHAALREMLGDDYRGGLSRGRGGRGGFQDFRDELSYRGRKDRKEVFGRPPDSSIFPPRVKGAMTKPQWEAPKPMPVPVPKLETYVLPSEKVSIARETRKVYAFCFNGNVDTISILFNALEAEPEVELNYRAVLQSMIFADHLLAYHDGNMMDRLCDFLKSQVQTTKNEEISQIIWRIFVVGWFKFARNAKQTIELLTLFIKNSKTKRAPQKAEDEVSAEEDEKPASNFYQDLFTTKEHLAPIELFSMRFFAYPQSFYFYEALQHSKVVGVTLLLNSKDIWKPQVVIPESLSRFAKLQKNALEEEKKDDSKSATEETNQKEEEKHKPVMITFKHKFRTHLLPKSKSCFSQQQVQSSLSEVPPDAIHMQEHTSSGGSWNERLNLFTITDQYFAMPLYQVLNQEMIDYDKPEIPRDDIEYLCERYSSEEAKLSEDMSKKERQEALFNHLMELREENSELRQKLTQAFMDAILQSMHQDENEQMHWAESSWKPLIVTFKRLVESGLTILEIRNPNQIGSLMQILTFIDDTLTKFAKRTENFKEMKEHHVQWLDMFKTLIHAVVWQMHLTLGSKMQSQLAYSSLPTLISIMESIKKIFNAHPNGDKTKPQVNILDHFSTTNNEGVDPTNVHVFETAHPYPLQDQQRKIIQVQRAFGYLIEIDPRSQISSHHSQLQIRSYEHAQTLNEEFKTFYEFRRGLNSLSNHQFFVYGPSVAIEWSAQPPRRRGGDDDASQRWGVRLTVKPLLGGPVYLAKQGLVNETLKPIFERINGDQHTLLSWFQLLNLMVFLSASFSQELTDGNLIHFQTDGEMTTGSGVFNLVDKKPGDSVSELSMSVAAKSQANPHLSPFETQPQKTKKDASLSNIMKSNVLNWYLFKSGLKTKIIDRMSNEVAMQEGLELIYRDPIKLQDLMFDSLKLVPEDKPASEKLEGPGASLFKSSTFESQPSLKRTISKAEVISKKTFLPKREAWSAEVIEFFAKKDGQLLGEQVHTKLRKFLSQEPRAIRDLFILDAKNNAQYKPKWIEVEVSLICAMLYHSDSLSEVKKFLALDNAVCRDYQDRKLTMEEEDPNLTTEQSQLLAMFYEIGKLVSKVISFMYNRLAGQKAFNKWLEDTIRIAQPILDKAIEDRKATLEKQRIEKEEKEKQLAELALMARAEAETRAFLEAEKKKKEEASSSVDKSKKKGPQVAKSKSCAPSRGQKRANVARLAPAKPLPKANNKKAKKQGAKADEEQKNEIVIVKKTEEETKEVKKIDTTKDAEGEKEEQDKIVLADLTQEELKVLKNKVSSELLEQMTDQLMGAPTKLAQLCNFFGVEQHQNQHDTLKYVFKQIKENVRQLIDLDDDATPVPEKLDISNIDLGSPIEEVARDVLKRVHFLFEVIPSTNYQAEVTKIVTKLAKQAANQSKRMQDIIEENEDDQMSTQVAARGNTEMSQTSKDNAGNTEMLSDSDSEELIPEAIQRSYSVPVTTTQPAFMKLSASKAKADGQDQNAVDKLKIQRKQSLEYGEWIEGYRKWRLWNKKGQTEDDLYTAYGSPLQAVFSFAMCREIQNLTKLRNVMLDHKYVANFRLFGLQQQSKLFAMFAQSIFGRFIVGGQTTMLRESVMHQVETCGETVTKQLNVCSRSIVQHLMNLVVSQHTEEIRNKKAEYLKAQQANNSSDSKNSRSSSSKPNSSPVSASKVKRGSPVSAAQAASDAQARAKRHHQKQHAQSEEIIYVEEMRRVLHAINDIKMLMSNVFTKEYILGSLKEDKQIQASDTLGLDLIKAFLRALMHQIVSGASYERTMAVYKHSKYLSSIMTLKKALAQVSQVVLNLFVKDGKEMMVRQSETQRILHEILLDIIVEQLEIRCYVQLKSSHYPMEESITLLQMLSEMIQLAQEDKRQSEVAAEQVQETDSAPSQLLQSLATGGKKVERCTSLLAYMMLNIEVPAVVRLATKCARALFKLVDLQQISLFKNGDTDDLQKLLIEESKEDPGKVISVAKVDFFKEALKVIGAKVTATETCDEESSKAAPAEDEPVKEMSPEQVQPSEETHEKEKVVEQEVPKKTSERKYHIYANLNIPKDEDFTFLITANWHWYKKHPPANLQLIKDPKEIVQKAARSVVVEEEKKGKTVADLKSKRNEPIQPAKPDESAAAQEEKKGEPDAKSAEQEKKGEPDAKPAAAEEEEKGEPDAKPQAEEEKKGEPDANPSAEEEKKGEPDEKPAAAEEEKKGEPDEKPAEGEEEKKEEQKDDALPEDPAAREAHMAAVEASMKDEIERKLKEVEEKEKELAEQKFHDRMLEMLKSQAESEVSKKVKELLNSEFREFDDDSCLTKLIEKQTKPNQSSSGSNSQQQPAALAQAYQLSRQKHNSRERPSPPTSVKIESIRQLLDNIFKVTFKNPYSNDSDEIKKRRMDEKNFNLTLKRVVEDAITAALPLFQNYISRMAGPFTESEALEYAALLEQAYYGKLEPVPLNPFVEDDKKKEKVGPNSNFTVENIFPITPAKVKEYVGSLEQNKNQGKNILVAPKSLVVSIMEERTSINLSRVFEKRVKDVSPSRSGTRNVSGPDNAAVARSFTASSGAASSIVIQELIQLVRSVIDDNESLARTQKTSQQSKQVALQKNLLSRQSSLKQRSALVTSLNQVLERLKSEDWEKDFSLSEKQYVIGLLSVISGWQPSIKAGQQVQVNNNNHWSTATVVDDGAGKEKLSVIYEDDDSLQIVQVSHEQIKSYEKFSLDFDGEFGQLINQKDLFCVITEIHTQVMLWLPAENNQSAVQEFQDSLLSPEFLLVQLLRLTSQLSQSSTDLQDETVKALITVLQSIQADDRFKVGATEGKNLAFWERELSKSWQSLIDKAQPHSSNFFSPHDYPEKSKVDLTDINPEISEIIKRASTQHQIQVINDSEYVQTQNTYLQGMPELKQDNEKSEQTLKLLKYWQGSIFPKTIEHMCRHTEYKKPFQHKMVLGQIKYYLLRGDIQKAQAEISTLYQQDYSTLGFIGHDHDWGSKIMEECQADQWALAFILPQKKAQEAKKGNKADEVAAQVKDEPTASVDLGHPLLNRLYDLGIKQILVQIKAVNGKYNQVLTEYYDCDTMMTHWIWFPIANLKSLVMPLGPRPNSYLPQTLRDNFLMSVRGSTQFFARQTILQFFQALKGTENLYRTVQQESLCLNDIISWAVLERFSEAPVTGWMKQFGQTLSIQQDKRERVEEETIKTEQEANKLIQRILEAKIDALSINQVEDQTKRKASKEEATGNSLSQIKSVFAKLVKSLESPQTQTEAEESKSVLNKVVEWCVANWYQLASSVAEEKAKLDLYKEVQTLNEMQSKDLDNPMMQSLPIHELLPKKGQDSIATLIVFKRGGNCIVPMSKIQFFSDKNQTNMIQEITANKEIQVELAPLALNEAKIWVKIIEGSQELLQEDEQQSVKGKLDCAIYQIPKQWTVICWLTEVISTSLIGQDFTKSADFCIDVISKLVQAIITFYEEASAPVMLKSVLLQILSRLMIKLRHIYTTLEAKDLLSETIKKQSHFERLFMSKDFVQTLLSEMAVHVEQEKHSYQNQMRAGVMGARSKVQTLFSQFIQEAVEFLMVAMVPTEAKLGLESYKALLPKKDDGKPVFDLPDWIEPLIKVSYFLHFFREEMRLPEDMMKEIYSSLVDGHEKGALDNIVVIRKIPKADETYSKQWIVDQIFELLVKHKAIVQDVARDVQIMDDEEDGANFMTIVLFLDSFSHLREKDHELSDEEDDDSKLLKLLHSETDDEGGNEEEKKEEEEEEKAPKEEEPDEWGCPICTVFNPMSNPSCEVCGQGQRPSKEELRQQKEMEKMQAKLEAKEAAAAQQEGQVEEKEALHVTRLKMLARDIRHVISHDQRCKMLAKLEEEKVQKAKEEEERKKKEEEDKEQEKESEEAKAKEKGEAEASKALIEIEENKREVPEEEDKKADADWVDEDSHSMHSHHTGDDMMRSRPGSARGKDDDDSDASSTGTIDFDNLPEDKVERFKLLGIDLDILDCGEEQIIAISEASAIEELMKTQETRQKKKAEKAKQKKAEEAARQAAIMKEATAALSNADMKMIKLEVTTTAEKLFAEDSPVTILLQEALRNRVMTTGGSEEPKFTARALEIISEIHSNFKTLPLEHLKMPSNEPLLEDMELTKESIKSGDLESFQEKLNGLIFADSRLFFKLLLSQGYDVALTRAVTPTFDIKYLGQLKKICRNIPLLRSVKTLIEKHYCKEKQIVNSLSPLMIRIQAITPHLVVTKATEVAADAEPVLDEATGCDIQKLVKATQVGFKAEEFVLQSFPEIRDTMSQESIRYAWALLQWFNKYFAKAVPFVNQREYMAEIPKSAAIPMSIATYMGCAKSLGLSSMKTDLKFLILDQTSIEVEQAPVLVFERLKMAEAMDKKGADAAGSEAEDEAKEAKSRKEQNFMFVQAVEQIKDINLATFRPKKPISSEPHLAFKIKFQNEKVQGDGGPYRQFFEDISMELQPNKMEQKMSKNLLGLLNPCRNQIDEAQEGKDKFMLNSKLQSSANIGLYYYLGVLMGVCIRTGAKMILDLPRVVWKQLVGQKVNLDDFTEVEATFVSTLQKQLVLSQEVYEMNPLQWVESMPDGTTLDLREGDEVDEEDTSVPFADRLVYVEKALKARLVQSEAQCKAIRNGISKIVPQAFLNIGTHEELETWVCGRAEVDVELLKRHCRYMNESDPDYGPNTPLINMFWQFMDSITEDQKQKFIKFCWGQQRLPANDEAFIQENVRFMIKPVKRDDKNQDKMLPTADTCFFNLGLPRYSSLDVMTKNILLAINMDCVSMNAEEIIVENGEERDISDNEY